MKAVHFLDRLQQVLDQGLPGEDAHLLMSPMRPKSSDALKHVTSYRDSAVGVVLYPSNEQLECLLIKRPSYEGTHGGQVSFPGGKKDAEDMDLEYTARRECMEEVGIPLTTGQLITPLTPVYIPVSQFLVQPYIFYIENLPPLIPDVREVERIIPFELNLLIQERVVKHTEIQLNNNTTLKNVPYFDIGGEIVWGATAIILSELREILKLTFTTKI